MADIYGRFGVFHYAKILPRCIGCYISGSDLDDALIETGVFGKSALKVNANHADDFQGVFLAKDTQLSDDLIQLQVPVQVYHLRSGKVVVAITCFLIAHVAVFFQEFA